MLCGISPVVAKNGESKSVTVGVAVSPNQKAELVTLAAAKERSVSYIAWKFMLRGWAAYERDGMLDEPKAAAPGEPPASPEPASALTESREYIPGKRRKIRTSPEAAKKRTGTK